MRYQQEDTSSRLPDNTTLAANSCQSSSASLEQFLIGRLFFHTSTMVLLDTCKRNGCRTGAVLTAGEGGGWGGGMPHPNIPSEDVSMVIAIKC